METMIARLEAQMTNLMSTNVELVQRLNQLETAQATLRAERTSTNNITVTEYTDVIPTYTTGTEIQLDAFKVVHEFNGDRKIYRSWRHRS